MDKLSVSACALFLPADPPEWVHIMPLGKIRGRDGREWTLTDAEKVVAASAEIGMDLPIDIDHAADFAPKGTAVPASGWIKKLEARADGIWGRVEWTAKGAASIRAGEFRYLSPVFYHRKDTGEVIRIVRASLTNNPDLYLKAVASKERTMDKVLEQLRKLLGLDAEADGEAIVAKATEISGAAKAAGETVKAVAKAAGLKEDAKPEEIVEAAGKKSGGAGDFVKAVAKAAGLKDGAGIADVVKKVGELAAAASDDPDPTEFVPFSEHEKVCARLAELENKTAAGEAETKVAAAMRDGKITPGLKGWALNFAKSRPAEFDDYVENAPVIVKPGGGGAPAAAKAGDPLSDEEKAVCRAMGITEADYKKSRDDDRKEEEAA